jgi:HAD superfamily hydrolase (TIGR01509 family)
VELFTRRHWVFDLDGTLTVAMHDFDAFRAAVGLPEGVPILEALERLAPDESAAISARLADWERDVARQSLLQPGARELLEALAAGGVRLGILTRNLRDIAFETLDAVGLREFFPDATVIGRDEAPPKPDPGGVLHLLDGWRAVPDDAVMVGDYLFDLQAGRSAGARTVYIDPEGAFPYADHADHCVRALLDLLD